MDSAFVISDDSLLLQRHFGNATWSWCHDILGNMCIQSLRLRSLMNDHARERPTSISMRFLVMLCDELNGRGDHVYIRCGAILGATVQSEYLEMETC
jgi:hypothetical protein